VSFINRLTEPSLLGIAVFGVILLLAVTGCQSTSNAPPQGKIDTIAPANPAPDAAALKPGLAVSYSSISANSIADVVIAGRGKPGKPLPHLNWQASDTPMMTSGRATQVSAQITGFIRFSETGTYVLKIRSNDGVRLSINGIKAIEDPTVHAARFSRTTSLTIKTAGWYKLDMLYFQKGGSAALELYWQPPKAADFVIVPGEAFTHLAGN